MSKKAREIFERHAKAYNVNTVRGQYGELLDSKARECWYFFFSAWKARARDIKQRTERRNASHT